MVCGRGPRVSCPGIRGRCLAEETQAQLTASVASVKGVDVSGLDVKRWARDEELRKNKYVFKSDEQIRDAVDDNIVDLYGTVDTYAVQGIELIKPIEFMVSFRSEDWHLNFYAIAAVPKGRPDRDPQRY